MVFAFLSGQTITLLVVAALLIFGPSKIPELAKSIGEGLKEFRKATTEVKKGLEEGDENKNA